MLRMLRKAEVKLKSALDQSSKTSASVEEGIDALTHHDESLVSSTSSGKLLELF